MLIILLSLLTSGIFQACATVAAEQDLLIFYSNDVIGETEPCG
jgi:hypothetical protein